MVVVVVCVRPSINVRGIKIVGGGDVKGRVPPNATRTRPVTRSTHHDRALLGFGVNVVIARAGTYRRRPGDACARRTDGGVFGRLYTRRTRNARTREISGNRRLRCHRSRRLLAAATATAVRSASSDRSYASLLSVVSLSFFLSV